ncbi:uncharacterized protein KGF55_002677 [Candida pseudojiufengensis]|uniref:uncharacterized protein n=1 Tax=Candida pseudojiufengensis TaxID=497109 RepID=UPI0022256F6C|nr:uncharacterized protein KGF55_002677 [Candida pseudojiufengensis]KAI5963797.1 hypothetical protein KGF55_002677 [Candida pseudojiufengensis]
MEFMSIIVINWIRPLLEQHGYMNLIGVFVIGITTQEISASTTVSFMCYIISNINHYYRWRELDVMGREFKYCCENNNIQHIATPSDDPMSNGRVKNINESIENIIGGLTHATFIEWDCIYIRHFILIMRGRQNLIDHPIIWH